MRAWTSSIAACALLLSGCGWVSFRKTPSDDELRLEREVRAFYSEIQSAFAAGNPQALASLYDASISKPMTKPEIEAWIEKFFAEHGRGSMSYSSFSIDELGHARAVVTLAYKVETPDGAGNFGGSERDSLIKRGGRWYMAGWQTLP